MNDLHLVSLYAVVNGAGKYFAGFDTTKGISNFVDDPLTAKKFTNKYDIKLRPDEQLVEMTIDLSKVDVSVSSPFRPTRRKQQ